MAIYVDGTTLLTSGSPAINWTPVFGDRGTWDTSGSPGYHARDIYDGYPTYHLPDDALAGQAPIWDGYKYVPGYVESSGSGGHGVHQHVEADILDLLHDATKLQGIPISSGSLADGDYLRYYGSENEWIPTPVTSGSGGDRVFGVSISGELAIGIIPMRVIVPWSGTINNIVSSLGINGYSQGTNTIVDILRNGVSIFDSQANMPTILENELDDLSCIPDYVSFLEGDVFTFDIKARGTSKVASNLIVQVRTSIL